MLVSIALTAATVCTARACTNHLDETQWPETRDETYWAETKAYCSVTETRPRRDVSTSRDRLETETSRPRPHPWERGALLPDFFSVNVFVRVSDYFPQCKHCLAGPSTSPAPPCWPPSPRTCTSCGHEDLNSRRGDPATTARLVIAIPGSGIPESRGISAVFPSPLSGDWRRLDPGFGITKNR